MVTIKFFASLKGLAGKEEALVEASNPLTVADLIAGLESGSPGLPDSLRKSRAMVAINQEMAHWDSVVKDGDEVAFMPPFAGGSNVSVGLVRLQRENFSVEAEVERVKAASKRTGAVVTFLGVGRDFSKGKDIEHLEFEFYPGMAEKKLNEIREQALRDFHINEVAIIHRHGRIEVGENIVLIVVGAGHRAEAFRACSWCIDTLKQITPIWKREQTPDGEVWVEEHP